MNTFHNSLNRLESIIEQLYTNLPKQNKNRENTDDGMQHDMTTHHDLTLFHPLSQYDWPYLIHEFIGTIKQYNKSITQYNTIQTYESYHVLQYYCNELIKKQSLHHTIESRLQSTIQQLIEYNYTIHHNIRSTNQSFSTNTSILQLIQLRNELKLESSGVDSDMHVGLASTGRSSAFVCDIYYNTMACCDCKLEIIRNDNTISCDEYNNEVLQLICNQQYDILKHKLQLLLRMEELMDEYNDIIIYTMYNDVQHSAIKLCAQNNAILYRNTLVGTQWTLTPEIQYNKTILNNVYNMTYIGVNKADAQSMKPRWIYMFEFDHSIVLSWSNARELYKSSGMTYGFIDMFASPSTGNDTYAIHNNGALHHAIIKHTTIHSNTNVNSNTINVYNSRFNVTTSSNDVTMTTRGICTRIICIQNIQQLKQLESTVNVLRQSIAFNILYNSCYNVHSIYQPNDVHDHNNQQPLDITITTQPNNGIITLAAQFPNTTQLSIITIRITVSNTQLPGESLLDKSNILTTIQFDSLHSFHCTTDYANNVLRQSASIAVMLHYICSKSINP